jgi:hypothetical protein
MRPLEPRPLERSLAPWARTGLPREDSWVVKLVPVGRVPVPVVVVARVDFCPGDDSQTCEVDRPTGRVAIRADGRKWHRGSWPRPLGRRCHPHCRPSRDRPRPAAHSCLPRRRWRPGKEQGKISSWSFWQMRRNFCAEIGKALCFSRKSETAVMTA